MKVDNKLLYDVKTLMMKRYPRFGAQIASANLEFKTDLAYHTAATDGKNIYFDPDYLASLSDDDKLFIIAHELMHVKFEHMFRMVDKNGQRRNLKLWNIATDAIINANLERDGFKIKEGYVNMPEALNYTAEEFYEKLLSEDKVKQKSKTKQTQNNTNNAQNNSQQQNYNSNSDEQFADDHTLWEKVFEEVNEQDKNKKEKSAQGNNQTSNDNKIVDESKFNEKKEFQENRQERHENAKRNMEKMRDQQLKKYEGKNIELGNVGEAKPILNWKMLLRREVERTDAIWSQHRSIAENNYAYRLDENDVEDQAETEVMIDVSGSVSLTMIKAFLRQLKPLLKESKLKVGCFNEQFWGMVEIKSNKDIDNFKIPSEARGRSAWTEDWDLAVRSFSKKREVNKIVFTDGEPCPGIMPRDDLKGTNVIWLVYSNRNFSPCCGKVIDIYEEDLQKLVNVEKEQDELVF